MAPLDRKALQFSENPRFVLNLGLSFVDQGLNIPRALSPLEELMPQIVLEYSSNLPTDVDFKGLFSEIHQALQNIAGIRLDNCKSRARVAEHYFIGDGDVNNAFVHLQIRFIEGRTSAVKQAIGEQCLAMLKQYYSESMAAMDLQITVEIDDLLRDFYFKYPEGSLTPQ
jgi:5-carboxymethyl-2-hydroxymuconate isomerase